MKKQIKVLALVITALLGVFFTFNYFQSKKSSEFQSIKQTFDRPATSIVRLKDNELDSFKQMNGIKDGEIEPSQSKNTYIVKRKPATLTSDQGKIYPNRQYKVQLSPNDTYLSSQWYLDKVMAKRTWDFSTGSSLVITAVVDTGFALNHQDLSPQWSINPGESGDGKESNSFDDDSDGFIDNWRGWNFFSANNNPQAGEDNPSSIYVSHGTSVTGVIGAAGNNGLGMAGLNWQGKILPLQAMNDDGIGYTSDIAAAIDHAVLKGAKVINLSLGTDEPDEFMHEAITGAISSGVVVVASAGNDGCNCLLYPANYPEVIAVGSSGQSDARSSFSSYGVNLDIVAPGESIFAPKWTPGNNAYGYSSGTSLAAPVVSATASLVFSRKPTASVDEINQLFHWRSDPIGPQRAHVFDQLLGYGRVNIMKAASQLNFQNGALVEGSDGKVYLIENGQKRYINSPAALLSHRFNFGEVQKGTDAQLAGFGNGADLGLANGTLVRDTSSKKVYLIESGTKKWILTYNVLKYQAPKKEIINLNSEELALYADGQAIFTRHNPGDLITNNGTIYILAEKNSEIVKRHILSPAAMKSYFYTYSHVNWVSSFEIDSYPTVENIKIKPGTLAYDQIQNKVYIISINGADTEKRWITSPAVLAQLYPRRPIIKISKQELAGYSDGSNVIDTSVMTDGVVARDLNARVYLIMLGKKKYIPSPQVADSQSISLNWATNQFSSLLDSMQEDVNVNFADGSLLSEGGRIFITNGLKASWILSGLIFAELSYNKKNIYQVNNNQLAILTIINPTAWLPLTGSLIRDSSGRVYLVSGASKQWITSPLSFNTRGYSASQIYQLSNTEAALYADSTNLVARPGELAYADDGRVYVLDDDGSIGKKSWVRDALILELLFLNKPLRKVSNDQLDSLIVSNDINFN